ncbi:MAG: HD domain-containing phosphohydrolase [Candidatus Omnitrophota bacterium]
METKKDRLFIVISLPKRITFKLASLFILFILIIIKLYDVFAKPNPQAMSNEMYLTISMILVIYLWIAESIDVQKYRLAENELLNVQRRIKNEHINTIASLILAQEAKDPYNRGHSIRVTQFAMLMGRRLSLSREELEVLERAAILHDIGKVGISDTLLSKVEKLTKEEMDEIRRHVVLSDTILKPLQFLKNERVLIRQHHEHYDGMGYPDKLKGEEILLGARILAVADFYDAVSSDRPYRNALSKFEIIGELKKNRGKQFDSKLADILLELIESDDVGLSQIVESAR